MQTLQRKIQEYHRLVGQHRDLPELSELIAVSGAAFRAYRFVPGDNYNWESEAGDVGMQFASLAVDNYGALEALRTRFGWGWRPWRVRSVPELYTLVRSELDEGRQLLRETDEGLHYVIGIIRDGIELSLDVERDGETQRVVLGTIKEPEAVIGACGALTTVRPEPKEEPERRKRALVEDMLGWIPRHFRCEKELVYDADAYFASGHRALLLSAEALLQPADGGLMLAARRAWLSELVAGRRAAAEFWRSELLAELVRDDAIEPLAERGELLERATSQLEDAVSSEDIAKSAPKAAAALLDVANAEVAIVEVLEKGVLD